MPTLRSSVDFLLTSLPIFLHITPVSAFPFNYQYPGGFDRKTCYMRTRHLLDTGELLLNDSIFHQSPRFHPMSLENPILTLPGCQQICGRTQAWYWDSGQRLNAWLIPILLLISNVELSPLDKRRFMAILHLLGDPIDSFWSMIHKIMIWEWCYEVAGRYESDESRRMIVGTVFAGFEEMMGERIRGVEDFEELAKKSGLVVYKERIDCEQQQVKDLVTAQEEEIHVVDVAESGTSKVEKREAGLHEWRSTALDIADNRSDEFFRTCLAIILYIYQIITSFVPELGGENSTFPGARIGTALFISWLVPAVLLSNTIGGFTSRRSCFDIMSRFGERTKNVLPIPPPKNSICRLGGVKTWRKETVYFESYYLEYPPSWIKRSTFLAYWNLRCLDPELHPHTAIQYIVIPHGEVSLAIRVD